MNRPVFIISAGRSGSTAMVKILETSINAKVFSEPKPKFCIEQRLLYEFGDKSIDIRSLMDMKKNFFLANTSKNEVYIDKNQNYVMFIPYLKRYLNAKFIILFRDGKDVVRSYMDWVQVMGKKIYQTHEDSYEFSYVSPCDSMWDFSFFRPKKRDELYKKWKELSLFDKFCWYWARVNSIILENIKFIREEDYIIVDMNNISSRDIKGIFTFCNLKGFNEDLINQLLNKKINSIQDRIGKSDVFPKYDHWSKELKEKYHRYTERIEFKIKEIINEHK